MSEARQHGYAAELESFFRARLVDGYPARAADLWQRDYSSDEAYLASVEPRREAFRAVLSPPSIPAAGVVERRPTEVPDGSWLSVPLADGLTAQGLLVAPRGAERLVVFQHGLGSTPERLFDLDDNAYDGVAAKLTAAGYAVLAPMNLIGIERRNRAQSLARIMGTTVEGIEFARFQALLQAAGHDRYALAGMSWGGLAAQYWGALDDRAKVVATLGFFNDRALKMVVQDTRYATFYDTGEHHAFLHAILDGGFGDADLASLVAPRPMFVSHGRADAIGWWPQIEAEAAAARLHWERLGAGDRFELNLHDGGHVVRAEPLLQWLADIYPPR